MMDGFTHLTASKGFRLWFSVVGGLFLLAAVMLAVRDHTLVAYADPIEPPEGYPKLSLSVKAVTPTLSATGGVTLYYTIEIRNTGAYTAVGATLTDVIPENTTYGGDAQASVFPQPAVSAGTLTWMGDVGFDSTVVVSFSVAVDATFGGTVRNTAIISHPLIAEPITVTAETVVTDGPILTIKKTSSPAKPGASKPLSYTIVVANQGQPMVNQPITVTDRVPLNTTVGDVGADGVTDGQVVTWTRNVSLQLGETTAFTFSVDVDDVPSGTVIANDSYWVVGSNGDVTTGEPYTVTVVTPIFLLSKRAWPDPPGSNREMTYTLTLLNVGSLATDLVITDRVPVGSVYQRGGTASMPYVRWELGSLDTGESAEFTFTVYISDVMGIPIVNGDYGVCSAETCARGKMLTNIVQGPVFEAHVVFEPIAKKPGGGGGTVTPTLVVRNLGPGNALDAWALLEFRRVSVSANDLYVIPIGSGTPPPFPDGPACGDKCVSYVWVGDLAYGEVVTFTTTVGQSTIGGEEGTHYTATIVITDGLSNMDTVPVTGTAVGKITHMAYLNISKSAPPIIGRGRLMTYTIDIWNSGLATDDPPTPWLQDIVPAGTTVVSVSHGGTVRTVMSGTLKVMETISWTLPAFGTGERIEPRWFTVRVDNDLVSGTQIVNDDYHVFWYEEENNEVYYSAGPPVTTTVKEVGLVDSYKEVTPRVAWPGPNNVLTYYLHIVNSSPLHLDGVTVYDELPWQSSTYQRDAVASGGTVVSDVVSIRWTGSVAPYSSRVVTFSVLVDPYYEGVVVNTAVISHPGLLSEVVVDAVAYITTKPVLQIVKSASPDPVKQGAELAYTVRVVNLGQQATGLVITDTIPSNTAYVPDSATAGGELVSDQVRWEIPELKPGEDSTVEFRVTVGSGLEVVNDRYGVRCAEGVVAVGEPVTTSIKISIISLTSVTINGPTTGSVNTIYVFTATVSPPTATLPITYTWSPAPLAGQGAAVVTYTWSSTGPQTITVKAVNAGNTVSDTHVITIAAPVERVTIDGPVEGTIYTPYAFTAIVDPLTATLPIVYTWSPMPVVGQGTPVVTYTWPVAGSHTITVTATNSGGMASDTHIIIIGPVHLYMPWVARSSRGG
jgi:uncharacterized repeat protein (TIGR01451 family)